MAHETIAPENIFINLDFPSFNDPRTEQAMALAQEFGVGVKMGTELTGDSETNWVPAIQKAHDRRLGVFADTKSNDISETTRRSLTRLFEVMPYMVNIHASAGDGSLEAFREIRYKTQRAEVEAGAGSLLVAVTVLSTKSNAECFREYGRSRGAQVSFYTDQAEIHYLDGIICAGEDLENIRDYEGLKVVIGSRPLWAPANDQKNFCTPHDAVQRGATHLAVGRPVTDPPEDIGSPREALERILEEVC